MIIDTYFNPTLVTDTEIFVLIDENTPYANAIKSIKSGYKKWNSYLSDLLLLRQHQILIGLIL